MMPYFPSFNALSPGAGSNVDHRRQRTSGKVWRAMTTTAYYSIAAGSSSHETLIFGEITRG